MSERSALVDQVSNRARALARGDVCHGTAVPELLELAHADRAVLELAGERILRRETDLAISRRALELCAQALGRCG